jgi:hypothetical protein
MQGFCGGENRNTYIIVSKLLFERCGVLFWQGAARTIEEPVPILVGSVWLSLAMTTNYVRLMFVEICSCTPYI